MKLYKKKALNIPAKDPKWNSPNDFYKTKSKLYNSKWVVYAKEAFGGPEQVLEYLGRYTHRIAISNYRIIAMSDTHVTFRYLDRAAKKNATKSIEGEQFIKLFLLIIHTPGFKPVFLLLKLVCSATKQRDKISGRHAPTNFDR